MTFILTTAIFKNSGRESQKTNCLFEILVPCNTYRHPTIISIDETERLNKLAAKSQWEQIEKMATMVFKLYILFI